MAVLKLIEQEDEALPQPIVDLESKYDRVLGFGKPFDWSFRPYNGGVPEQELLKLAPALYLPKIAVDYGLGKFIYAPIPSTFNAKMCSEAELMAKRVELRSSLYHTNVWLYRGAYSDGTVLKKGHAIVFSLAGCPLIKMRGNGSELGVVHAGRDCLIDRGRLEGKRPRKYESVVMSLTEAMLKTTQSVRDLEVEILFSINPEHFPHPWSHAVYGAINKRMTEEIVRLWGRQCILNYDDPKKRAEGKINPEEVIRSQLISLGVCPEKIRVEHAPSRELWADTREGNGTSLVRNMAIVHNL
jgi:hypothetical protein